MAGEELFYYGSFEGKIRSSSHPGFSGYSNPHSNTIHCFHRISQSIIEDLLGAFEQ